MTKQTPQMKPSTHKHTGSVTGVPPWTHVRIQDYNIKETMFEFSIGAQYSPNGIWAAPCENVSSGICGQ